MGRGDISKRYEEVNLRLVNEKERYKKNLLPFYNFFFVSDPCSLIAVATVNHNRFMRPLSCSDIYYYYTILIRKWPRHQKSASSRLSNITTAVNC